MCIRYININKIFVGIKLVVIFCEMLELHNLNTLLIVCNISGVIFLMRFLLESKEI